MQCSLTLLHSVTQLQLTLQSLSTVYIIEVMRVCMRIFHETRKGIKDKDLSRFFICLFCGGGGVGGFFFVFLY